MKVENIPSELFNRNPWDDGMEFGQTTEGAFLKYFSQGEDRTSDSILLDAFLSFTIQN